MDKKEKIIHRIKKIEGQINGITKMIEEEKDCLSIVQQIAAAKAALSSLAKEILISDSCKMAKSNDRVRLEKLLNRLTNIS